MILTFSVFKEKIEDGTKTQTIRPYNERQFKRLCNAKKYQLYWHNPRNGGKLIKEVEPNGRPFVVKFQHNKIFPLIYESIIYKDGITEYIAFSDVAQNQLAKDDGFFDQTRLYDWFHEKYGEEMFTKKFMVIRWMP